MELEDWFMKQINLLGRVLGKILADLLGLKAVGRVDEGIEIAEKTLKAELDLSIDDLVSIPLDHFIISLRDDRKFSDEDLEKLADIFSLIADGLEAKGTNNEKVNHLLVRSLAIYEYLDKTGSTYSMDRHAKIEKIKKSI
jgi:hypothetical protein